MSRKFIIVVDMQNDFVLANGALPVPNSEELVDPANNYLAHLDPKTVAGVLFTFDTHAKDVYKNSEEGKMFPIHCVKGTHGWELALEPCVIDDRIPIYHLEKGVFDMWKEPSVQIENEGSLRTVDRDTFFKQLVESGVERIEVWGVASDFCVKWAIDGLETRGFIAEIKSDLTRGIAKTMNQVVAESFANKRVALV